MDSIEISNQILLRQNKNLKASMSSITLSFFLLLLNFKENKYAAVNAFGKVQTIFAGKIASPLI